MSRVDVEDGDTGTVYELAYQFVAPVAPDQGVWPFAYYADGVEIDPDRVPNRIMKELHAAAWRRARTPGQTFEDGEDDQEMCRE